MIIRRRALLTTGLAAPAILRSGLVRAEARGFIMASGQVGGVYDSLGKGIAGVLGAAMPGTPVVAINTNGSYSTIDLIGEGKADLGFSQVDAAVAAYEGDLQYKGKPVKVRALAVMYINHLHAVTTEASGITTINDLRGKRISTGGVAGSSIEGMSLRTFVVAGIDRTKDFASIISENVVQSAVTFKAGKLDAIFFSTGMPAKVITEIGNTPGIKLRLIDHANLAERVRARYGPVYFPDVIPAGTYPGQTADNNQLSVGNLLVVSASMPDAQAKAVLTALWGNRPELIRAHSEARNWTIKAQTNEAAYIPYHPGAGAFWREQGAALD